MYIKGEIVKDCSGQWVEVIENTDMQRKTTIVQKYNHWSKYQYPTYLPRNKVLRGN